MAYRFPFVASIPLGMDALALAELQTLGAHLPKRSPWGVGFRANIHEVLRIALHSRLCQRILLSLGEFESQGSEGLYEASAAVPWEEYLRPDSTFCVEARLRHSEHLHSGFVALKLKDALVDRMRQKCGSRPNVDAHNPDVRIVAWLYKNRLHLFLDVAGQPMGRRGWRSQQGAAPLQEGLAAALLAWAGYSPKEAFCDPMCGCGTLAIEAALMALGRAPGFLKTFAMERWPSWKEKARPLLAELKKEARLLEKGSCPPIVARDLDESLLEKARQNAKAAGVLRHIRFEVGDATTAPPPGAGGLVACNPPYGLRLETGGQKGMKAFYFKWGEAMKRWTGWRLAVIAGNPAFESAFHRRPSKRMRLKNGPLDCQLLSYSPITKTAGLQKKEKLDKNWR